MALAGRTQQSPPSVVELQGGPLAAAPARSQPFKCLCVLQGQPSPGSAPRAAAAPCSAWQVPAGCCGRAGPLLGDRLLCCLPAGGPVCKQECDRWAASAGPALPCCACSAWLACSANASRTPAPLAAPPCVTQGAPALTSWAATIAHKGSLCTRLHPCCAFLGNLHAALGLGCSASGPLVLAMQLALEMGPTPTRRQQVGAARGRDARCMLPRTLAPVQATRRPPGRVPGCPALCSAPWFGASQCSGCCMGAGVPRSLAERAAPQGRPRPCTAGTHM